MKTNRTAHLKVFKTASVLVHEDENESIFEEGAMSVEARARYDEIKKKLQEGFLEDRIERIRLGEEFPSAPADFDATPFRAIIESVTSEVGRALVGLILLQATVKSIAPSQSIRLHKGSGSSKSFSWKEGISMRSLDKEFVTPVLRKFDLVKLNADGFMMTRSLAENYPYSRLYKAYLRGAREEWMDAVEILESSPGVAPYALDLMLSLLLNRNTRFNNKVDRLLESINMPVQGLETKSFASQIIRRHIQDTNYAARILEIAIHSVVLAACDLGIYGGLELQPLGQMRSANKKHKNIADIELTEVQEIKVAIDAKFGKKYLREEIEEVFEKFTHHNAVEDVIFLTDEPALINAEITERISEIEEMTGVLIEIIDLDTWLQSLIDELIGANLSVATFNQNWLHHYCEYFGQRDRSIAPIDEPCEAWIDELTKIIDELQNH